MPVMTSVTMENFRCFRERQTVRLAPLTLLVGENSTGKTSFLALLRALHECAFVSGTPDFKTPPFDLGSFRQIAFDAGGDKNPTNSFTAGFESLVPDYLAQLGRAGRVGYEATFRGRGSSTAIAARRLTVGSAWLEQEFDEDKGHRVRFGTDVGEWQVANSADSFSAIVLGEGLYSFVTLALGVALKEVREKQDELPLISLKGADKPGAEDWEQIEGIGIWAAWNFSDRSLGREGPSGRDRIFAGGPIRSHPKRTYDPASEGPSPYGEHVPSYLAAMAATGNDAWIRLKQELERVGKATELFEGIEIGQYGGPDAGPFQVLIGMGAKDQDTALRNLADVGYGVGQALPLVTELLGPERRDMLLFQQPEVHLHPRAQAGIGSLLCELASEERQLVVETHSDHLMDRVRMDVRDGKTQLRPDDVLILFFERNGLDVQIHEICWDESGNIIEAPSSYRRFFMEEVERSIWPPD